MLYHLKWKRVVDNRGNNTIFYRALLFLQEIVIPPTGPAPRKVQGRYHKTRSPFSNMVRGSLMNVIKIAKKSRLTTPILGAFWDHSRSIRVQFGSNSRAFLFDFGSILICFQKSKCMFLGGWVGWVVVVVVVRSLFCILWQSK